MVSLGSYCCIVYLLLAEISISFSAKVGLVFAFPVANFLDFGFGFGCILINLYSMQVYVVYMGTKTGEEQEDILTQDHQMLAHVHSGRFFFFFPLYLIRLDSLLNFFFPFFLSFFFFLIRL